MRLTGVASAPSPPAQDGRPSTLGALALSAAARHRGAALTAPGRPPTTYPELGATVREIAGGLASLGIELGDRVAVLAGTRPEWTLVDFGALCAGAVVVPVYHTSSPEECAYVLGHSESRVVVCEDAAQAAKVAAVRTELPALEHVVVCSGEADGALALDDLRRRGREQPRDLCEVRLAGVAPGDVATIVYTSGTTGPPKGCVLTHANLLATAAMYEAQLDLCAPVLYLYLPLAHVLARVVQIVAVDVGGTLAFWSGDPDAIVEDLGRVRPTHFPSVPRVFEKIHAAVLTGVAEQRPLRQAVFRRAVATGARMRRRRRARAPSTPAERLRHALADRLVLSRVRGLFGDRLELALTGAAPIGRDVLEFFDACGITVLEGYGMTETCAAATLNTPAALRLGTVGRPLPGTSVAIAGDGEVLMRGPHTFAGYHRDEPATRRAMEDGWLRSGDLGALDDDGYLAITGRKKDLIITSSGKNVSPENIETALRDLRWISNAVVVGDRRPYLVALLTLDGEHEAALPAERMREQVQRHVDAVNARFARIEQVKRFAILPRELSQAAGELTPTMRVRRAVVQERYADVIDALYG